MPSLRIVLPWALFILIFVLFDKVDRVRLARETILNGVFLQLLAGDDRLVFIWRRVVSQIFIVSIVVC